MRVKCIIPRKEKVSAVKTTEKAKDGKLKVVKANDFFRAIPVEENREYDRYYTATKDFFTEGNFVYAGDKSITEQGQIIKNLERMYEQHETPSGLVFDYDCKRTSVHAFLREIYLNQNLSIFRHLPIMIINYSGGEAPLVEKIKVLAVNGSPRKKGDTKRILTEEVERNWTGPYYESEYVDLGNVVECTACGGHQKNCKPDCIIDDQVKELMPKVKEADVMLIGSPVYMDLPTSRTLAFLSRLTGQTKHNRRAYLGKQGAALSPGWCSGTKTVISSLTNALEMMGFTIQGRSSREYIGLWMDEKTRGGVPNEFYWPK